jgi:hypothetical protein
MTDNSKSIFEFIDELIFIINRLSTICKSYIYDEGSRLTVLNGIRPAYIRLRDILQITFKKTISMGADHREDGNDLSLFFRIATIETQIFFIRKTFLKVQNQNSCDIMNEINENDIFLKISIIMSMLQNAHKKRPRGRAPRGMTWATNVGWKPKNHKQVLASEIQFNSDEDDLRREESRDELHHESHDESQEVPITFVDDVGHDVSHDDVQEGDLISFNFFDFGTTELSSDLSTSTYQGRYNNPILII